MEGDLTRLDSVPAASEVPPLRQPVYIGRRIYHLILLPRYHRMLGLASLWRWLRAQNWRQWWERAALFWRWIVKVVLNLVACLSFLVIVALLYEIVTRQSIVIEPISVPQVLASNGYTPDVAARRLRDALQRYHEQAKTKMPSGLALHSEQPNFVVPTVGLSSEAITTFIRTFFGSTRERNISGEFTIVEHQLRLRLRTSGAEFYTSADGASPENPDRLLETAAPNIFDVTEPYVVATMQYGVDPETGFKKDGVDPETGFKKAEEIVARWPSSNQNVVWFYILMGEFFRDRSDHDSAIMRYNEAINHNPKVAVAFNNRGLAYRGKRDLDRAIADYNEAIRLDPKYARAFYNRGLAYDDKGDLDHAIADYNEAIRFDPKNVQAFNNRGAAYYIMGNLDHAIADFSEATRLDPKYALAFKNRGIAYQDKGDLNHAIADFNEVIRLNPKDATAFINRGNAYSAKGDLDHATADYNEARVLDLPPAQ